MKHLLRKFLRQRDGATVLEFAIIAPVFFLLLMGILEFGLFMYHKVIIESITMQIGREASLGRSSDPDSPCASTTSRFAYIRCYVQNKSSSLINGDRVEVQINTIEEGGTAIPDICLAFDPPSSQVASCPGPHEEVNGTPGYQGTSGTEPGEAGELVEVRVSYPWRVLVPLMGSFVGNEDGAGQRSGVVMITSSTIFRNEPFE